jgi:hypothetical protein
MEGYLKDKDSSWYDIPNNIVGVLVNPITGKISLESDSVSKMFYFLKGTEPYIDDGYDLDSVFKEEEIILDNSSNDDDTGEDSSNEIIGDDIIT